MGFNANKLKGALMFIISKQNENQRFKVLLQ